MMQCSISTLYNYFICCIFHFYIVRSLFSIFLHGVFYCHVQLVYFIWCMHSKIMIKLAKKFKLHWTNYMTIIVTPKYFCSESEMFGMWVTEDVDCLRWGMFGMNDNLKVECLGCEVFEMWDVVDVRCLGCVIFAMRYV